MWYHMRRWVFTSSKQGDGKLSPDSGSFPFFPSIVCFCVNSVFFFTLLFVQTLSSSVWHAAPSALSSLSPACVKSFPLLHYIFYTGTPSSPWIYSITPLFLCMHFLMSLSDAHCFILPFFPSLCLSLSCFLIAFIRCQSSSFLIFTQKLEKTCVGSLVSFFCCVSLSVSKLVSRFQWHLEKGEVQPSQECLDGETSSSYLL